ncbi:hypothetical protein C8J56DRAFT_1003137 [Mycena floridula]|nr:hypothetical protein C8J56DRAFT_1003137 [Mycena floridula]
MTDSSLTLILSPDDPCNTNIFIEDGRIMYQVATDFGRRTITRVLNGAGERIASWEWRDVRSDIITLGQTPPVAVNTWLRKSVVPFKDTIRFQDHTGQGFKWKGGHSGLQFELFIESDKKHPIASFQKSRRTFNHTTNPPTEMMIPAQLYIDYRGQAIRDLVVISFLVLEKNRRVAENSNS